MNPPPFVRRGEPITVALWNQLSAAVRACRVIAGDGVRTRETPDGTIINFDGESERFVHPWLVTLIGRESATIRPGTVNRVEGTIKSVPLAGDGTKPPPALKFGQLRLDGERRGWICVEITCEPKEQWAIKKAEIVQVADPDTPDGEAGDELNTLGAAKPLPENRARHPLAMIRERKSGRLDLFQITFFDLQHRVALTADQKTAQRHFFW
jgi:hypothetical protein